MSTIYEIFGRDAHAMTIALMERAEVITAIPAGASVALKPNLVVAGQPEYGATTHAGVLSGAIEYLREHGVRDISIIEGSWVGDSTGWAFRAAGYDAVGKQYSVPLYDLKGDKTRQVDTPPAAHGHLLPGAGRGVPHQSAGAQGPLPGPHDLRPQELQGLSDRPGEAALPRRGAHGAHCRPGRRPEAGTHHRR